MAGFAGLTPEHRAQYLRDGYTVLSAAIPEPLVLRLHAVSESARALARESNPQAQRLQPVQRDDLAQAALIEYGELAHLRTAITELLTPDHKLWGDRNVFGILFEPRDAAYCTNWHRDWRDNIECVDLDRWWGHFHDPACFDQINCALYDDDCLWVVPGRCFHTQPGQLHSRYL